MVQLEKDRDDFTRNRERLTITPETNRYHIVQQVSDLVNKERQEQQKEVMLQAVLDNNETYLTLQDTNVVRMFKSLAKISYSK